MMFRRLFTIHTATLALLCIVLLGAGSSIVFASPIDEAATGIIGSVASGAAEMRLPVIGNWISNIFLFIQALLGLLIKTAAWLSGAALGFNQSILNFDPPFITVGWQIFRDIANLGFVFGIIVIAIATILRSRAYQAQSILWKLIVAALLVNFSLVIGGTVIKASDVFSNYFLKSISGQTGELAFVGFTERLTDEFKLNLYFNPTSNIEDEDDAWGQAYMAIVRGGLDAATGDSLSRINSFVDTFNKMFIASPGMLELGSMFITIIVEVIMFLTLLAFAAMLLLRYFWLSFLLMLSPIVWLLWIFPHTKHQWTEWWKKFIHWVLYAPTVLFFTWLALTILRSGSQYADIARKSVLATGGDVGLIANVEFGFFMNTIMAAALLIGGMKAAQAIGYGGTGFVLGTATKAGKWTRQRAGRWAARGVSRGMKASGFRDAARKYAESVSKGKGNVVQRFVGGTLARSAMRIGAVTEKKAGEDFGTALENIQDRFPNKEDFLAAAGTFVSSPYRSAAISHAQQKGWLDADMVEKLGGEGAVLESKERFERWDKGKDFGEVEVSLGKPLVIYKLEEQYAVAAQKNDTKEMERLEQELRKETEAFSKRLKDEEWKKVGKSVFGKNPGVRKGDKSDMNAGQRKYRQLLAERVYNDPSGKSFSKVLSQLSGIRVYDFLSDLVLSDTAAELEGARTVLGEIRSSSEEETEDRTKKMTRYERQLGNTMQQIRSFEQKTPTQQRLLNRIKKTVLDDVIAEESEKTGPVPKVGVAKGKESADETKNKSDDKKES